MEKIAILYGSTTGNTESVANTISGKIADAEVNVFEISDFDVSEIKNYSNIVLGTSTWGIGDLQDDWEDFLPKISGESLTGKVVAIYGLGDADSYADSFVDGIGTIYESIKDKGCKVVGGTSVEGYSFSDSTAVYDGAFVGLPLDEDNESNLTDTRVDGWLKNILPEFI